MDAQTLLELVMSEIGPLCPEIAAIVRDPEGSWAVQYDNGGVAHISRRTDPERVELMLCVGIVPKDTPVDVLRALMMFNFLSAETGGTRMGLGALDDGTYLIRDLCGADITASGMLDALRALAAVAAKWSSYLEQADTASQLPPIPALATSPPA